jgi:hypothetical protein
LVSRSFPIPHRSIVADSAGWRFPALGHRRVMNTTTPVFLVSDAPMNAFPTGSVAGVVAAAARRVRAPSLPGRKPLTWPDDPRTTTADRDQLPLRVGVTEGCEQPRGTPALPTANQIASLRAAVAPYLVNMAGVAGGDDRTAEAWRSAASYLKRFFSATSNQKSRLAKKAPLGDLHAAALHHPDAFARRECLSFLDHYANEASTAVFAEALNDPVDFVRNAALHSIACESCRTAELCVADVVPSIVRLLEDDPSPELRTKAIPALLRLADRDSRARQAIGRAAEHDPDGIVRRAAADALCGYFVAPRKRYERRQRRHGRRAARTAT